MPIKTKPLELGAPLSEADYSGDYWDHKPKVGDVTAELIRAQIELIHAVAKHRQAWSRMRKNKNEAEERSIWAESYPPYKIAVADVRWWREEMTAQAATVTALTAMLNGYNRDPRASVQLRTRDVT